MTIRSSTLLRWNLVTVIGTVAAFLIPCLFRSAYYFHNDVPHYFMPMAHEIGVRLQNGEWPILTLRSLYSGNLLGEGQFGLFNPVTLSLYWLLAKIPDLIGGAMLYAGFHVILLALGVAALARALAISPQIAAALAVTATTSTVVSYVDAPVWWNAITCNAWLVWCVRNWVLTFRCGTHRLPSVITSVFVITAGWPHGSIALAIVWCGLFFTQTDYPERLRRRQIAFGVVAALLMSLPLLIPMGAHVLEGTRAAMSTWNTGQGTTTIDGLLAISWPSFITSTSLFLNTSLSFPIAYGGWFIVPVLFIYRRELVSSAKRPVQSFPMAAILCIALVFGILSLGPAQLGPLRWPIRFVFYYQLCLLLAAGYLVSQSRENSDHRGTAIALIAIWTGAIFLSWQQSPDDLLFHFLSAITGLFGSLLIVATKTPAYRSLGIIAISLLVHLQMHYAWPYNDNVIPLPSPTQGQYRPTLIDAPNTLILQSRLRTGDDGWKDFPSGNIAVWENRPFINGYTPVQPKGMVELLCYNNRGYVCSEGAEKLFAIDPVTSLDVAALLRIGEIRSESGRLSRAMSKLGGLNGFSLDEQLSNGVRWKRPVDKLAGTLSYACPEASVSELESPEIMHEHLLISNPSPKPCLLIWARTAFPGYEVRLNDEELTISRHLNVLVATTVPPQSQGALVLRYLPFGWRLTVPAFLLGLIFLLVFLVRGNAPSHQRTN